MSNQTGSVEAIVDPSTVPSGAVTGSIDGGAVIPTLGSMTTTGGGGVMAAGGIEAPFHSASLYVGDLAPDVNEGLLFEIFNAVGPVASIRVCRDAVTRRSLGYAYVNYHQIADAERALDTMNYTMIKSRPCRIMWSQRDPSLRRSGIGNIFVKNLHESIDNKQLYDTFSLFGNILSCKVVTERESGRSMGYGYVHYETAEAANAAIEKLDGMLIDGQEVQVGHFMRRCERPGQSDWTNCYVKNIPYEWDDAMLYKTFSEFGEVLSATIAMGNRKRRDKKKTVEQIEQAQTTGDADPLKNENVCDVTENAQENNNGNNANPNEDGVGDNNDNKANPNEDGEEKSNGSEKLSLGYGFVSYLEHEAAQLSVEKLNGVIFKTVLDGEEIEREFYVGRAQKKAERVKELNAKFETLKMDKITKYQGVNIYVKNLDDAITDDVLRGEFSVMGTITSARVMRHKDGLSKGFGFVCFSTPEEANRTVNEMNGKIIGNKPIFVALAQRRDVRRAQLEAHHIQRGGVPGSGQGQPNSTAGMMRGPMGGHMGYPGAAVPMYMQQRPGPGGSMQPMYPVMPQMMAPSAQQQQGGPRSSATGAAQQQRAGYNPAAAAMIQQRGVYPMPAYGVVQSQQPGTGRGGRGGPNRQQSGGRGSRMAAAGQPQPGGIPQRGVPQGGRGGVGNAANPQQQLKFNQQARNAGPSSQPGMQGGPPQVQQISNASESLTASSLASATPEMQKNMIGERLYPLIHASQPDLAGKITGMLLEMDNSELLHLLESPDALMAKITEALQVLEAHNASVDG